MKKWLLLFFFIMCADIVLFPTLYAHSSIEQLHDQLQDGDEPVLDLDGDIISDDEDLLAILDESMEEPSLLWTWFQTIGSSLAAHCIHAQRYMSRFMDRMKFWFKLRKGHEQKKVMNRHSSDTNSQT